MVGMTATQGRRLLTGVNMLYTISGLTPDGSTPTTSATSSTSASSCFAASEIVNLENGHIKAMVDVQVGDRVLTINAKGEQVFSDVVYLPHAVNEEQTTFAQITTESGRDLKMTLNHILPAGACALSILPLIAAGEIVMGDCVQTVSGREQVVSINKVEDKGIYTIIAMEELIVVNGIVATPYGGINPTLANMYYNLYRLMYSMTPTWIKAGRGYVAMDQLTLQGATENLWKYYDVISH